MLQTDRTLKRKRCFFVNTESYSYHGFHKRQRVVKAGTRSFKNKKHPLVLRNPLDVPFSTSNATHYDRGPAIGPSTHLSELGKGVEVLDRQHLAPALRVGVLHRDQA